VLKCDEQSITFSDSFIQASSTIGLYFNAKQK